MQNQNFCIKSIKDIFDNLNESAVIINKDFRIEWINKSLEKKGFDEEKIKGHEFFKVFDNLEEIPESDPTLLAFKTNKIQKTAKKGSDGNEYEIISIPLTENNEVKYVLEITEPKKIGEKSERSFEISKELFDHMKSGVAIYEARDGGNDFIFRDFNKAAQKIDNVKKEDIVGKSVLECFPGVKEFGLFEVFKRVWKTGKSEHHPIKLYKDKRIFEWRQNYVFKLQSGEVVAIYEDLTEQKKYEEKIIENEKLLKKAQEIAHLGHWKLNPETEEVEGSDELFRIFGLSREQATLEEFGNVVHPEDREFDLGKIRRGIDHGEPWDIEHRLILKDGTEKTVHAIGNPITDENGKTVLLVGTVQDITESKKAEEKLKESQQKLNFHLQHSPIGAIEWDLNFKVTDWNLAAQKIFGYSKDEAMGRHAAGLLIPESAREHVDKVWNSLLKNIGGSRSTNENFTKDGKTIVCDWYNTPILDVKGNVTGVASLVQDITERKETEEKLHEISDFNQYILNTMPFVMDIVDEQGNILYMDHKFKKMLGKDVIGNRCWDIYKDDKNQCDKCPLKKGIKIGETSVIETSGVLGGKFFEITHTGMMYQGKKAILEIFQDITGRKMAEDELKTRNEELEKFNKISVGRELKMIELKNRIKELEGKSK